MNSSSREADYAPKQEDKSTTSDGKISKNISSTTSWSRLKDPRIVRVSRAFGGKDRHSKVFTVRGLRDRRVRLSVPTAIQLYDLQDRLGLNQPSKVVDWLLNAAKHEIDELPPLQLPPAGNFSQFHHQSMASHVSHEVNAANSQSVNRTEGHVNWNDHLELSNYYGNTDGNLMRDHMKSKELVEESEGIDREELTKRKQDHNDAYSSTSNNFLARANVQSGMLNNAIPIQNSSFLRWDPSNLSLSHTDQDHLHHNYNVVPVLPSTSLSTPSGSQFVLYQPGVEFDSKQMINFQMLSSASTSQNSTFSNIPPAFTPPLYSLNQAAAMRPFHLSMNPNYDSTESAPNKDS